MKRFRVWLGHVRWLFCLVLVYPLWAAPTVTMQKIEPHWFDDGNQFWYRKDLPGERRTFIRVHAGQGRREEAFDSDRLAAALSEWIGETLDADRLPIESLNFDVPGHVVRVTIKDRVFNVSLDDYSGEEQAKEQADSDRREDSTQSEGRSGSSTDGRGRRRSEAQGVRSPDGRWEVRVKGHNLVLRKVEGGDEVALTHDGNPTDSYQVDAQRRRLVEMSYDAQDPERPTPEVFWAPDSSRFVAMRHQPGTERRVYLIESSPEDQLQPKLDSYPYLKPGDTLPVRKPRLFDVGAQKEIPLSDMLYANPWSIGSPRWDKDSTRFTFSFNQRGHQVLRLLAVDGRSGETRALIEECSETFVHYSGKYFMEYLEDTAEILWMSERSGWNHLYLYDAKAGEVKQAITQGEWLVQGVERVDRENRQIWFRAGGLYPDQDPYFTHFARVDFDGHHLVRLTEGNGTHSLQFSPDRRYYIDTWSRVDLPPIHELRRATDGVLLCTLDKADATELFESGWQVPEPFVAKGRDGKTDIYGLIHRPQDFDPDKSYPVIENIYAGPHSFFVPKSFRTSYGWERLASKGFVIVKIDGMGTSGRSKAFHDVCWQNLADAGFPDRILWMQAAAKKYPALDLSRVGIYGGSAGGQNAMGALLWHGDFYRAAAADCGCHDNRMDKIWWNEQWMGWPVGPHYVEQSNVTQAHRLKGKLLLTVGEMDKNVDPSSTYQVVDALIRADKEFEFILFPGRGHGAGGSPYGDRRRTEFFIRHLGTPTP